MKVVILAGGLGTRISEESDLKPKPMIEIGGKPIIWHIMKIYESYGYNDFVICCGYKGHILKEYFLNYFLYNSDISVEVGNNKVEVHYSNSESFKVTLVDTGLNTNTAGRIKKIEKYVQGEPFMLNYGDGVSNVNIHELIKYHHSHGKLATLTSIREPGRFGSLQVDPMGIVTNLLEKPMESSLWINGGYFVLEPGIFKYLEGEVDHIQWEKSPLAEIAADGQLSAFRHHGFWKCMDAMRDKIDLEELWKSNKALWKIWQ